MKELIKVWPGLLSDETCDEIIRHGLMVPPIDATVGADRDVRLEVRRSVIRWIERENEDFRDVWDLVWRRFHEANAECFGVDIGHMRSLQFTEYSDGYQGHYDWHVDVFWRSNGRCYDRKLSMVIQLSEDDYEGGDLELEDQTVDRSVLRKRGSIIVFPSFVRHRVTPVTRGTRHSLVTWMEGPAWR